jgi:hypothetical protein
MACPDPRMAAPLRAMQGFGLAPQSTFQRWSMANAIINAISAAATAQAMPIMIRLVILTPFANPTGHARLTVRRTPAERVACEFSGLTLALSREPHEAVSSIWIEPSARGSSAAARC